jgi:hypothetical protein
MYLDLQIPPGVRANGTSRESRGFYRDASLVRWNPTLQPVKGWQQHSSSTFTGSCRTILPWKDNTNTRWIGLLTHSGVYVMTAGGAVSDITPVGFTAGRSSATTGSGYGTGLYGSGLYGTPRTDTGNVNPATVQTADLWNDRLVFCSEEDGDLYQWNLNTAVVAATISGAPTGCAATAVTPEGFQLALKFRTVYWSDQGDNTSWTASATNQAGDLDLITRGTLMCAKKVRGKTLLFTNVDVWEMEYQGLPSVYGIRQAGDDCGPLSKGCIVARDTQAYWMGKGGFFGFNGFVDQLPCDVLDKVFSDFNDQQASKVTGWHNAEYGEVWWHYPSAGSQENDRYVFWSYRMTQQLGVPVWGVGALARTAGAGGGVFTYPLLAGTDGKVYDHEQGTSYGGTNPYARTAPLELGAGDQRYLIRGVIPDEKTQGQAQLTFYGREFPNTTETAFPALPITGAPVDCTVSARQFEMLIEFTDFSTADPRVGINRLDVVPQGKR